MRAARIMVVDDDSSLLGFTSKYLARLGYSVTPYRIAEEAWKSFSQPGGDYSLVILDLSLPGLSGEQLSRMMLRASPTVRLVLTSGYPFDVQKLIDAGPDRIAFLHKPFTPSMLVETVNRLVSSLPESDAD